MSFKEFVDFSYASIANKYYQETTAIKKKKKKKNTHIKAVYRLASSMRKKNHIFPLSDSGLIYFNKGKINIGQLCFIILGVISIRQSQRPYWVTEFNSAM